MGVVWINVVGWFGWLFVCLVGWLNELLAGWFVDWLARRERSMPRDGMRHRARDQTAAVFERASEEWVEVRYASEGASEGMPGEGQGEEGFLQEVGCDILPRAPSSTHW